MFRKNPFNIARKVINKRIKKSRSKKILAYLNQVATLVGKPPPEGVYICCFCQEDNLLSQWRGYGENGTGVSIAFNPDGFRSYSGPDMPIERLGLTRLWKVFYSIEIQENIVENALDLIPELNSEDSDEIKAAKAADAIHFFMPTFKNEDFEQEDERRLIFTPSPKCAVGPSFRVARGMLAQYYSLKALGKELFGPEKVRPLPIVNITIGPRVRQALNIESAKMLLSQNGYKEVTIQGSDTPFRG